MKKFFVLIPFAFILVSCKKKDSISSQTIHGQVYNLCTDSGMANITVYLSTSGAALNPATTLSTISDANGIFSFINAQIHSSSEYEYSLYIPSKSDIGGVDTAFDGGGWDLVKDKLSILFVLNVVPHYNHLHLHLPQNASITDTFTLLLQQNVYHKNMPNDVYQLTTSAPPHPPSGDIGALHGYAMGWWYLTTDKVKNGIHIIKTDSIYIRYGATQTDTIPW